MITRTSRTHTYIRTSHTYIHIHTYTHTYTHTHTHTHTRTEKNERRNFLALRCMDVLSDRTPPTHILHTHILLLPHTISLPHRPLTASVEVVLRPQMRRISKRSISKLPLSYNANHWSPLSHICSLSLKKTPNYF